MPHIHGFTSIQREELQTNLLRNQLAELEGSTAWSADIHDCGELVGVIEAVTAIQPGTALLDIWVAWEGADSEEITTEQVSLLREVRTLTKEAIQAVVDEI